jgi:hypothetical protein
LFYSYPNPAISNLTGKYLYQSSGLNLVELQGRYFSNAKPNLVKLRTGSSLCVLTDWKSDTAMICRQSPSLGKIRSLALTVERSNVAEFNLAWALSFVPILAVQSDYVLVNESTGCSVVKFGGAGYGIRDYSIRLRSLVGQCTADAMIWTSNTQISAKFVPSHRENPGLTLTIVDVVSKFNYSLAPMGIPIAITSCTSQNVPTTGSLHLALTGAALGQFCASLTASLGGTGCQATNWVSDSFLTSKVSAGLRDAFSIELIATASQTRGNSIPISYNSPTVNSSASLFFNNSDLCAFNESNSSICATGRLLQLLDCSSGYGTYSLMPKIQLSIKQSHFRSH